MTMASCTGIGTERPPLGQKDFASYQRETTEWLIKYRAFQTNNPSAEVVWNAPKEWRPNGKPQRGVLLIHGLGDSPWSFQDVAEQLAKQGFLVRTLLLPGHGTQPADMLDVRLEEWRTLVSEQAAILQHEVPQLYLGGFSTGANLALEYASSHAEVAGLLLFSPAFRASTGYDWLAPLISWAKPWLRAPDSKAPQQNAVRYLNMPTNGFAQFYHSSVAAQTWLEQQGYDKPVFMVVAKNDSVLDTPYLLHTFQTRFSHPSSRLIWYGDWPKEQPLDSRILVRSDLLPAQNISQFSHMSPLFAPNNPLYGQQGSLRICWNGQDSTATQACEQGAPIWFSDWGYRESGKIHARLTYNPYFDWQTDVMAQVFRAANAPLAAQQNAGQRAAEQK